MQVLQENYFSSKRSYKKLLLILNLMNTSTDSNLL